MTYSFVRTAPAPTRSNVSVSSMIDEFVNEELLEDAALGNSPERVYANFHAIDPAPVPAEFHPALADDLRADYWRTQGIVAAAHQHIDGDELDVAWSVLDLMVMQRRMIARIDEVCSEQSCSEAEAERLAELSEMVTDNVIRATHWVDRAQFHIKRQAMLS